MKKLFLIFVSMFTFAFGAIDSARAVNYYFTVTTTNQTSSSWKIQFYISAKGTFYVDCGTNGTLSRTGGAAATVSGGTITKTGNVNSAQFKCLYTSSGSKIIRFGGVATAYNTDTPSINTSTFGFNVGSGNTALIASISGNLSTIFPYISATQRPFFWNSFYATSLTSIPDTLFSGYTTGAPYMFYGTFKDSTSLTSIPADLFKNITTGAPYMFYSTFKDCTSLTSIPADLFKNITTGADAMFSSTFQGCTSLTSIPVDLFKNITTGAPRLYWWTFAGCTGLTSIPTNLFNFGGNNVAGQTSMFSATFDGCAGLTSIPKTLFSRVTSVSDYTFWQTFNGCSGLTGYVPPTLFSGLIANGSPYVGSGNTGAMYNIFAGTGLLTACPTVMQEYTTGYESYWNTGNGNAVSCSGPISLNWYDGNTQLSGGALSCAYGGTFTPPTPPARTGYVFAGWRVKEIHLPETCNIDVLDTTIGGSTYGYIELSGQKSNATNYGLKVAGQWAVEFSYGTVYGKALCSSQSGSNYYSLWSPNWSNSWLKTPVNDDGRYCYCQVTGFTAYGNAYTAGPTCTTSSSSLWVYNQDLEGPACRILCSSECVNYVSRYGALRAALFGVVGQ